MHSYSTCCTFCRTRMDLSTVSMLLLSAWAYQLNWLKPKWCNNCDPKFQSSQPTTQGTEILKYLFVTNFSLASIFLHFQMLLQSGKECTIFPDPINPDKVNASAKVLLLSTKLVWPASNPNGWDLFCLRILLLDLILVLFTVIFQIKSKIWFTLAFLETLTFFYFLKLFCEKWSSNLFLDYVDVNVLESVKFHPCQYPCSIFGSCSFTWSQ